MSNNVNSNAYNDDAIRALKGAEKVRFRPSVMFGSDDIHGAFHTVTEIGGNAIDEARAGFGKRIEIRYHIDGSISTRDFGRGVPMGWNKAEGRFNWDLIFNELYAGGKYDSAESGAYDFTIGLNGLGAAATQFTSEWFNVTSFREDNMSSKSFVKGAPTADEMLVEPNTTGTTGTLIHWKIDNEVFHDTQFPFEFFKSYAEGQAHINEVTFYLFNEATGEEVTYVGEGLDRFLRQQVGEESVVATLTKKQDKRGVTERGKKYHALCELVVAVTEDKGYNSSTKMYFHNTGRMKTGVHNRAFSDALEAFFKNISKQTGVAISPNDYDSLLSVIVSSYSGSDVTSYEGQTKHGVTNQYIFDLIYYTTFELLSESLARGVESIVRLVELVTEKAQIRKQEEDMLKLARQSKKLANKRTKAEKFVDCKERDPKKREIYILEGDSALGACKLARDGSFQALIPVKGKTINCLKKPIEEIMANAEVKNIISTLGTGIDIDMPGYDLFSLDDLQFDKIIICTDGDVDGFQIRVLLFTLFYRLMPKLLLAGKVYVAETPLFEIITNRNTYFAYSVAEKDEIIANLSGGEAVSKVNRSKGLGENDPDMLWDTTMNPETRKLFPLTCDVNSEVVRAVSTMLFGEDYNDERKEFIFTALGAGLIDETMLVDEAIAYSDIHGTQY